MLVTCVAASQWMFLAQRSWGFAPTAVTRPSASDAPGRVAEAKAARPVVVEAAKRLSRALKDGETDIRQPFVELIQHGGDASPYLAGLLQSSEPAAVELLVRQIRQFPFPIECCDAMKGELAAMLGAGEIHRAAAAAEILSQNVVWDDRLANPALAALERRKRLEGREGEPDPRSALLVRWCLRLVGKNMRPGGEEFDRLIALAPTSRAEFRRGWNVFGPLAGNPAVSGDQSLVRELSTSLRDARDEVAEGIFLHYLQRAMFQMRDRSAVQWYLEDFIGDAAVTDLSSHVDLTAVIPFVRNPGLRAGYARRYRDIFQNAAGVNAPSPACEPWSAAGIVLAIQGAGAKAEFEYLVAELRMYCASKAHPRSSPSVIAPAQTAYGAVCAVLDALEFAKPFSCTASGHVVDVVAAALAPPREQRDHSIFERASSVALSLDPLGCKPRLVPLLVDALDLPGYRYVAIERLGQIGSEAAPAVPKLIELASAEHELAQDVAKVGVASIIALGPVGRGDDRAIRFLRRASASPLLGTVARESLRTALAK